jgi:hypothetical protein
MAARKTAATRGMDRFLFSVLIFLSLHSLNADRYEKSTAQRRRDAEKEVIIFSTMSLRTESV